MSIMNIGKEISGIRNEQGLTQEEFAQMFHVTRQTVSNWENEKSYPDLQSLVTMSDLFEISLDKLLKEDKKMVKAMDKERLYGQFIKRKKSIMDFFTGAGTGILISCLISPDSVRRTSAIFIGLAMLVIGQFKKSEYDKAVMEYIDEHESADGE